MGRGQLNLMMSLYAVFYAEILKTHKELSPTTKGLRNSPRWQGYSTYLCMDGKRISINYFLVTQEVHTRIRLSNPDKN